MTNIALPVAIAFGSYLLGSLNAAIIVSRLLKRDDIRRHGSGNAGMTNMLRTYGKGPAAITALADFLKAAVAIVISRFLAACFGLHLPLDVGYLAGIFAILGHLFPLYFGFKGGKGVMTAFGAILCINPMVFGILAIVFIPLILITRIVSVGSVFGAISYPFITWGVLLSRGEDPLYDSLMAGGIAILILVMHRDNIKRLLNGTENRFGKKKEKGESKP